MNTVMIGGHEFALERELVDVTSNHRPDPTWRFTDAAGHLHQWYLGDEPASGYTPMSRYHVPTVERVDDPPVWCGDCMEEHHTSHWECRQCREHITLGFTADTTTQYISGLASYAVDGQRVSKEEFKRLLKEAGYTGPDIP